MASRAIVTKQVELADNFETNELGVVYHDRPDASRILDLVIHLHSCYPGAP